MACQMKTGIHCHGFTNETALCSKTKGLMGYCSSSNVIRIGGSNPKDFPALTVDFMGKPMVLSNQKCIGDWRVKATSSFAIHAQASTCVSRAQRWWEKRLQPNMVEIHSAEELVVSLRNAGDRLVIVDFYSPGCGGCKALHPKICQLAESNPDAIFLKVNHEKLKTMCYSLHVHVLPFFRFYRGAEGRVCSFSCTNATIKKFKDAMAKYGAERRSLGPAKGLDESELLKLASAGELPMSLPFPYTKEERLGDLITKSKDFGGIWSVKDVEEESAHIVV
ncbi:hypothetical protein Tsubulata_009379 [Turnera subulata]|uniref:Thioredoxin domain-containing protein n=1 Tax=Turnera subulata TaxID=218843 RepID=A0A9Q0G322_9ROSI|nr:hypothetical protein Tsubulata_009379 [Turnera subulata]